MKRIFGRSLGQDHQKEFQMQGLWILQTPVSARFWWAATQLLVYPCSRILLQVGGIRECSRVMTQPILLEHRSYIVLTQSVVLLLCQLCNLIDGLEDLQDNSSSPTSHIPKENFIEWKKSG